MKRMALLKKHLSFISLRQQLSRHFNKIEDHRSRSCDYSIHDTLMSGFAMMYFQEPSMLEFQAKLEESGNTNNLKTMFGVEKIPKDSQMRNILDEVVRTSFNPVFKSIFSRLQRGKHIKQYEFYSGTHIVSLDASQYFSSKKLHCSGCLEKQHKSGEVSYSHQILQAAMMHPNQKQVLPFMPEEIRNEDGYKKQDCEVNAGKRLIELIRKEHPRLDITLCGDGLFSKQPMIEHCLAKRMHYIFVAKPADHKVLMEWVDVKRATQEMETKTIIDDQGKEHVYEWVNGLPLNGKKASIQVNYFRYHQIVTQPSGEKKVTYRNSWVTDFQITTKNVAQLTRGGRCRWKIENECFNTLKNQGYCIEHNYGHGSKNLSFNFLLLTLLAFYFHQVFELTDHLFQECRKKYGSKKRLWNKLRALVENFIFDSWESLLSFIVNPPPPIKLSSA